MKRFILAVLLIAFMVSTSWAANTVAYDPATGVVTGVGNESARATWEAMGLTVVIADIPIPDRKKWKYDPGDQRLKLKFQQELDTGANATLKAKYEGQMAVIKAEIASLKLMRDDLLNPVNTQPQITKKEQEYRDIHKEWEKLP